MNEENGFGKIESEKRPSAADPVPVDRAKEAEEIASALGHWFVRKLIKYLPAFFLAFGVSAFLMAFFEKGLDYRKYYILLSILFVGTNLMWFICNMEADRKSRQRKDEDA